jgi:hypothetical protein
MLAELIPPKRIIFLKFLPLDLYFFRRTKIKNLKKVIREIINR